MKRSSLWIIASMASLLSITLSASDAISLPEGAIAILGNGSDNAIALSPDGRFLAIATALGVELRETQTWTIEHFLADAEEIVVAVAFSPDGTLLAAGSYDRASRVWDTNSGELLFTFPDPGSAATSVAFSSDGSILAAGSSRCSVLLWSMDTGELLNVLEPSSDSSLLWGETVACLTFSPDDSLIAAGYYDSAIRLWDAVTGDMFVLGEMLHEIHDLAGVPLNISFTQNGNQVLCGSLEGSVRFWDVETGKLVRIVSTPESRVTVATPNPSGTHLAVGTEDGAIVLLDLQDEHIIWKTKGHVNRVSSLFFSTDGAVLVSDGVDCRVRTWDTATGTLTSELRDYGGYNTPLIFSEDGRYLIADRSLAELLDVWDLVSLQKTHSISLPSGSGIRHPLGSSPDGKQLISGTSPTRRDGTAYVWDIETGEQVLAIATPNFEAQTVAFSPSGEFLAIASFDRPSIKVTHWNASLQVHNAQTGDIIWSIENDHTDADFLMFSADSSLLVSETGGTVGIWEAESGELVRTIEVNADAAALSRTGEILATAAWTSSVLTMQQYDLSTGELIQSFSQDVYGVQCSAFSPDGNLLATGSLDDTLRLWSITTGELLFTIESFLGMNTVRFVAQRIAALAFSPDGMVLAMGSMDGTIVLWNMKPYVVAD
jgi:WD40 repeat protein